MNRFEDCWWTYPSRRQNQAHTSTDVMLIVARTWHSLQQLLHSSTLLRRAVHWELTACLTPHHWYRRATPRRPTRSRTLLLLQAAPDLFKDLFRMCTTTAWAMKLILCRRYMLQTWRFPSVRFKYLLWTFTVSEVIILYYYNPNCPNLSNRCFLWSSEAFITFLE